MYHVSSQFLVSCQIIIKIFYDGFGYNVFFYHIYNTFDPPHDKTNRNTVRPSKTQISLGIRLV